MLLVFPYLSYSGFCAYPSPPVFRPLGGTRGRPHPRCRQQKAREQVEEVVHLCVALFIVETVCGSRHQVSWFLPASSYYHQVRHTQEVCVAGKLTGGRLNFDLGDREYTYFL